MSDDGPSNALTYPGGMRELIAHLNAKRTQYADPLAPLPQTDAKWDAALDLRVDAEPGPSEHFTEGSRKYAQLADEMNGAPVTHLLNAYLIALLRRDNPPPEAAERFIWLWTVRGTELGKQLSPRWLVSSATTFAEHGATERQRRVGLGLMVLFDLMKLYETERLFSGKSGADWWAVAKHASGPIALDMAQYSMSKGDLDRNMLARLWLDGIEDDVIRPLVTRLLGDLNRDDRTVFRRLMKMRNRLAFRARKGLG